MHKTIEISWHLFTYIVVQLSIIDFWAYDEKMENIAHLYSKDNDKVLMFIVCNR